MKGIATILVFVLVLPFGLKMGIVSHYWANLSYYATELCENTDKPELNCDGNCQVSKELNKTDSNPKSPISINLEEINLFTLKTFNKDADVVYTIIESTFSTLSNNYILTISEDFFRPPEHYRFS